MYESTDFSQDGKVTTLQKASEGNGIDIVLIGDAFSDRTIADGTYANIMARATDMLFLKEPFKSFRHLFNVYAVTTVSKIDGYDGKTPTACKGVFYNNSEHIEGCDKDIVLSYAKKAVDDTRLEEAMMIVVMNSPIRAGLCELLDKEKGPVNYNVNNDNDWSCGKAISYVSFGPNDDEFAYALIHENNGHGFAKLRDEYHDVEATIPPDKKAKIIDESKWGWNKNIDFTNDKKEVKWAHFLYKNSPYLAAGEGVYEGAYHYDYGVYRPTEGSIMLDSNSDEFNAPSREAIYYRIHKLAYGSEWKYSFSDFVKWDAKNLN